MPPTFGTPHPDRIYHPRPAVYAVICDDAGRVALVREAGHLFLPGGGIEAGEEIEAALAREVREECCWTILVGRRLGEALQYFKARNRYYASHGTYFAAAFTGEIEGKPEHQVVWLEPGEAAAAIFHDAHRWAVEQALASANS
jgi:8-oxo-dGTP diphosphatase